MLQTTDEGGKFLFRKESTDFPLCLLLAEQILYRNKALTTDIAVPDTWNPAALSQSNEGFHLCPVTLGSKEYRDVESRFRATMSGATIALMERVQNMELWDDFSR